MKRKLILLPLLLALLLPTVFCAQAAEPSADGGAAAIQALRDPAGAVLCAAFGMRGFPENSLEGVLAASGSGADFVLADVSETADGMPVLMKNDAPGRMLAEPDPDKPTVRDYTEAALTAVLLLEGSGGRGSEASDCRPATLSETLEAMKTRGAALLLRCDTAAAEAVCKEIEAAGCTDRCALYLTGSKKEVLAKTKALAAGAGLCVLTELRSNIFFEVTGRIAKTGAAGAAGLVLKTTNRYGVNFHSTVLGRFTGMRAAIDLCEPETAGARADAEKWWDDLISRGYSLIITGDAAGFAAYKDRCETCRAALREAYDGCVTNARLPAFRQNLLNDYKKAYTDAEKDAARLLSDPQASAEALSDAAAALHAAYKNILLHFDELETGQAGLTVTPARIALCVAAAAAVVWVEVFFYKKRKPAKRADARAAGKGE